MENNTHKGYSICLNKWALDKSIKNELGLLLIISSLTAKSGICFASNGYFAELFQIDEVTVSRKIKKIENKGYIEIAYLKRGAEILKREIRLTEMLTDDKQKSQSTINKNVKDNITSINITSINKIERKLKFSYDSDLFIKNWNRWLNYRKDKKKKYVNFDSEQSALKKLEKISENENDAIQIINESIAQGWVGLFPLAKKTEKIIVNQVKVKTNEF